jgi:hypothetical protein
MGVKYFKSLQFIGFSLSVKGGECHNEALVVHGGKLEVQFCVILYSYAKRRSIWIEVYKQSLEKSSVLRQSEENSSSSHFPTLYYVQFPLLIMQESKLCVFLSLKMICALVQL